jgi:hypothetical protein
MPDHKTEWVLGAVWKLDIERLNDLESTAFVKLSPSNRALQKDSAASFIRLFKTTLKYSLPNPTALVVRMDQHRLNV